MLQLFGILSLVVAVAAYLMNMHTSFVTEGGRQGQNPCVAAAAIQVPLLTMLGLSLLDKSTLKLDWSWWHWPTVWFVETLFVTFTMIWIGDVAYRKARRGEAGLNNRQGGSKQ